MSRQWHWPLALGAVTLAGLLAALIGGGGMWWPVSWTALAVPLAVAAWHARPLPPRRASPPPRHR